MSTFLRVVPICPGIHSRRSADHGPGLGVRDVSKKCGDAESSTDRTLGRALADFFQTSGPAYPIQARQLKAQVLEV